MKKIEELGISPWPWHKEFCEFNDDESPFEIVVGDNVSSLDGQFNENDANLITAAPKLYQKAYEVADNLLIHLMTPYQTIEIHRDEVAAMVKDLQSALAKAAGEEVAK